MVRELAMATQEAATKIQVMQDKAIADINAALLRARAQIATAQ